MVATQLHPSAEQHDNPENRAAYSVAEFRENPQRLFRLLRADRSHLTLTVEGEAEAVLLAPAEYQRLLDLAAAADVLEAIRQSTEDEKAGLTQPAIEFFAEFRAEHGQVDVSARARRDMARIHRFIRAERAPLAQKWFDDLEDAILSLPSFLNVASRPRKTRRIGIFSSANRLTPIASSSRSMKKTSASWSTQSGTAFACHDRFWHVRAFKCPKHQPPSSLRNCPKPPHRLLFPHPHRMTTPSP